ncbi:BGTF surface domain-containing protein [Halosimplex amylolyticum]|uniref:BGTF surface domain-containing protein n=1 Tax=Halosimplex amylolyticum TaxID=3396616 RepID=UPI003F553771
MIDRTYGTVGAVAVVLIAAVAVVSAGGVPLGGDASPDPTATPGGANATTIHHDGSTLSLEGAPNQTVSGETDLAPGTELSVRLISADAESPFLVTETTTVGDDGTFGATVDLAHVDDDASAWATVVRDGTELTNVSARIAAVEHVTPTEASDETQRGTTIDVDGDRLTLAALENETISGETDLDAGTELTVRLSSTSSSSPFLIQETATVGDDGSFEATVDLVGIDNGTTFRVTVRHDGETVASADGMVVGGENNVSTTDESNENWTAVPANGTDEASETDHNTTLDYEGDALTLESAPNQTVTGETDLAVGTNVTVRLVSSGGSSPFLKSARTTVTEDGRFRTAVNMSTVPPGTEFEVTVRHDGAQIENADGEVVE